MLQVIRFRIVMLRFGKQLHDNDVDENGFMDIVLPGGKNNPSGDVVLHRQVSLFFLESNHLPRPREEDLVIVSSL